MTLTPPGFFDRRPPPAVARLLQPVGMVYDLAARARTWVTRPARPGIPVICIGNPTLGGAGKTPTAIAVAHRLARHGHTPHILLRGYGGTAITPRHVLPSDTAATAGDEALLLARHAPTVIARDRRKGAEVARAAGADCIVMDDGFQNPTLHKDLSILVIDADHGMGNGLVFPAGPLRMGLGAQLRRADALIVVGAGERAEEAVARFGDKPVLRARLVPEPQITLRLDGARVIAFAGIGRPDKFFATLTSIGADIVDTRRYPDHHPFTPADARALITLSERHGAALVTTEKDAVRLAGTKQADLAELARRARVLPVALDLAPGDDKRLGDLLRQAMSG